MKTNKTNFFLPEGLIISGMQTKTIFALLIVFAAFGCTKEEFPPPTLNSISPESGPKNTMVTIKGSDFGTDQTRVKVFFNEKEAVVQTVSNNQIEVTVPAGSYTGFVKIIINETALIGPKFTYVITDIQVSTLAGSFLGFSDGTGPEAHFDGPIGVTADTHGNVYTTDTFNDKIRKITSDGVVTTVAGRKRGFEDGIIDKAQFYYPMGVLLDTHDNIYVADWYNHKIRKITGGVVTTLAGSSQGFADGAGADAQFDFTTAIAIDLQGNIYVADENNHKVRKIAPDGEVSTLAGSTEGFANGTGINAQFRFPTGVAVDTQGNVYVADFGNSKIRKIAPDGLVSTFAGSTEGFADDIGTNAQFASPFGIATDSLGNIYVADRGNHKIRKITPTGAVSTLAGSGIIGDKDGTGAIAEFKFPTGVAVGIQGNIYVADSRNHTIRKISQE